MRVVLTIPGRFPGLNEYINACKSPYMRARMKREATEMVAYAVERAGFPRFRAPVEIEITCYEKDLRRDADNVHSAASKFVLDGLQACGVIGNDNRTWVPQPPGGGVERDKLFPRVEVSIEGDAE